MEGGAAVKSANWALILGLVLAICLAAGMFLWNNEPTQTAVITSGGDVVATVDLRIEQSFVVTAPNGGTNTITVRNGKIAVTAATCPDHHCMGRGFCAGGAPIVCLPNKLVITFKEVPEVDGAVG